MKTSPLAPDAVWYNLTALTENAYPGRGTIVGTAKKSPFENPAHVMITFIGGRSKDSRNRQYVYDKEGDCIKTAFIEPSDADPTNIIYVAMDNNGPRDFVASNGHQTTTILSAIHHGDDGHVAQLEDWEYESDVPNSTSRISVSMEILTNQPPRMILSRVSKAPEGDYLKIVSEEERPIVSDCIRESWSVPSMLGIGYMLTTYVGNGNPIPSYFGPPMTVPLEGTPEEMLTVIWEALNQDTRVAICLRIINGVTGEYRTFIKNGDGDIVEV